MSYHGYLPLLKQHIYTQISRDQVPTLLEVGVDRGVTFVCLTAFLARVRPSFAFIGVDILVQEQVTLMLNNLDLLPSQQAYLVEENSLTLLPKMIEQNLQFDVVLLDGDHNYHTVIQELNLLDKLVKPTSLIICDDYLGRWSERDLWYAERAGYENVKDATLRVDTEKHGVKAAVDEWLAARPEWKCMQPIPGEPILMMRKAT